MRYDWLSFDGHDGTVKLATGTNSHCKKALFGRFLHKDLGVSGCDHAKMD